MLHFYSDSRLAFPHSDYTSLGFIALMFTTLHSIVVFESALPYYHLIQCNSVNGRSICKSCLVQLGQSRNSQKCEGNKLCLLHFCSDSRLAFPRSDYTSLSHIALMFTTLHSIVVFESALPYYHMIKCNSANGASRTDLNKHGQKAGLV